MSTDESLTGAGGGDLERPGRPGPGPLDLIRQQKGMFGAHGPGDTSGYGRLRQAYTMPPGSDRPYGGYFDEVVDLLAEALADEGVALEDAVEKIVVYRGELTLNIEREHLVLVARLLRDEQDLRFELCLGVSGVHYLEDKGRELHAFYPLNSITHNRTINLEVTAPDADPHVPSLCQIYPANDWHEREMWDFFGLIFDGHPSLSRIQMPDDWVGHPQRKDYPLGGVPVEYKGATVPAPDNRRSYS